MRSDNCGSVGLIFMTDIFFALLAWIIRPEAFKSVAFAILLFTVAILSVSILSERKKRKKRMQALSTFLNNPDAKNEAAICMLTDKFWHPAIHSAAARLNGQLEAIKDRQLELSDYQDFIEAWTHEIKTPLSLATLLLNNHREEMSPYVYTRMEHVRHMISSDVDRILYYARLRADHTDYRLEPTDIGECLLSTLEDYRAMADEKGIKVETELQPAKVMTDKKVLSFVLSQLLSNAFKYAASPDGIVSVTICRDDDLKTHLVIRDNGKGALPEDIPFLFDKGFTGNRSERQNATGMGLYFVKKYSEALAFEVGIEPFSARRCGFAVRLIFPHVEKI